MTHSKTILIFISSVLIILSLLFTQVSYADAAVANIEAQEKPSTDNTQLSEIKSDETLVLFRTNAWFDDVKEQWHIPIHAWLYEFESRAITKEVVELALEQKYDLIVTKKSEANFDRRVRLMFADNERGKKIIIKLAGKYYPLKESEANGHIHGPIVVSAKEIESYVVNEAASNNDSSTSALNPKHKNRFIPFTVFTENKASTQSNDSNQSNLAYRVFTGQSLLLEQEGISVISDIDDTIKISEVTSHKKLFDNTFFNDFVAVPSMAEKYHAWHNQNVSIHFVSSSPWQLYSPLTEFIDQEGFPWATLNLKKVRFVDPTLLNLFKKGTETKPLQIEPILKTYPKRKFILVGDSGEQDPEVYSGIYKKYKNQIQHIYIRNVATESESNQRFTSVFAGIPKSKWSLFIDPKTELPDILK